MSHSRTKRTTFQNGNVGVGVGYPRNWVSSTLEMPPSFFFYYPVTSVGMVPVVLISLEHDHKHFRTEKWKFSISTNHPLFYQT